jgi:sortase A
MIQYHDVKLKRLFLKSTFFNKLLLVMALSGLLIFSKGAYIKVKAQVAQVLLELAWYKQQQDQSPHKAWSWADGYPMAKITINQQSPLIILTGATGSNLAFGPSWLVSSSPLNRGGNSVIFAHNDTHFNRLKNISVGDRISVESSEQEDYRYQVSETKVIDEMDLSVLTLTDKEVITLITCYPFDSSISNSNLRFVVIAKRILAS